MRENVRTTVFLAVKVVILFSLTARYCANVDLSILKPRRSTSLSEWPDGVTILSVLSKRHRGPGSPCRLCPLLPGESLLRYWPFLTPIQ